MKRQSYLVWTSVLLAVIVCSAKAAVAQTNLSPLVTLQRRVDQLENEVLHLRGSGKGLPELERLPPPRFATQSIPASYLDDVDLTVSCPDCPPPSDVGNCKNDGKSKYPTVNLGGFFQADWGWFHQSTNNIATVGDIQDGADFRRARLNAHGDVADNVGYMIEFDFGFPGRPSFMDVYLDVRDTSVGTFRFGQWRHPIGMDGLTSVKELPFLERALPFAFLPFRQIGLGLYDHSPSESMTWAVSAFRFPTDTFGGNVGDNGGYGTAARMTWLPYWTDDGSRLLHLGAAYSFANPANDRVRYRNQPEFFISETGGADLVPAGVPTSVPVFVDTGPIAAQNFNLFAVEGGFGIGSFYIQSEAMYAVVKQIGGPTVSFSGAYAHAGYFLTGEIRPYNRKGGVFGRVKPLNDFGPCGMGAWELAARWSYIDLNDANIAGGRMNDLTFGVNWYLNQRTKFQLNYIHAFLTNATFGDSEAGIVVWRGQIDF